MKTFTLRHQITALFVIIILFVTTGLYTVIHEEHRADARIRNQAAQLCKSEQTLSTIAGKFIVSDAASKKAEAGFWNTYANNPTLANKLSANDTALYNKWTKIVKDAPKSTLNCH